MSQKVKVYVSSMIIILAILLSGCSNNANSYYNQGLKDYKKGEYESACVNFQKAIELRDDFADYYLDYGYCLIAMDEYKQAETMFKKVILDKENSIVNKNNEKAYRGLGVMNYMEGNYENALSSFNEAKNINSLKEYNKDILFYVADCNVRLGKYDDALLAYNDILASDSDSENALISRAYVNYQLGKYEDSIADYLTVKKKNKDDYDVYLGLYHVYNAMGKVNEATDILNQAATLSIKDDEDTFYLAKIHYYQGNSKQALDGFQIAVSKGFTISNYYMGMIYLEEGDYASAVYYFEQYLKNGAPREADFYNQLGVCYLETGEYKKALEVIQQGLQFSGNTGQQSLKRNEIIAYEYLGDFETAYSKMQSYITTYPEDEDAKRDFEFLETRQNVFSETQDQATDEVDEIVKP